jgi:hypothetical protein
VEHLPSTHISSCVLSCGDQRADAVRNGDAGERPDLATATTVVRGVGFEADLDVEIDEPAGTSSVRDRRPT